MFGRTLGVKVARRPSHRLGPELRGWPHSVHHRRLLQGGEAPAGQRVCGAQAHRYEAPQAPADVARQGAEASPAKEVIGRGVDFVSVHLLHLYSRRHAA